MELPAAVWDALAESAARWGGVGAGAYRDRGAPFCLIGHAYSVDGCVAGPIGTALFDLDISTGCNDHAVRRINFRRQQPHYCRVPWELLAAELGVQRGA